MTDEFIEFPNSLEWTIRKSFRRAADDPGLLGCVVEREFDHDGIQCRANVLVTQIWPEGRFRTGVSGPIAGPVRQAS